MNQFPVNGLRPNGECSPQGIQLVPGSMTGSCAGATLGLRENRLVGLDASGNVACEKEALVGTSFRVRSFANKEGTILIKAMSNIKDLDGSGDMRPAYEMVDELEPSRSLCDPTAAKDFLTTRLGAAAPPFDVPPSSELRVVAVSSELYDVNGKYVPTSRNFKWRGAGEEWLQLACADDALAKRSRAKFAVDQSERSRAALMMLTANYCGTPGAPITVRGMKISWEPPPTPTKTDRRLLEARWDADGATCVGEPRILHQKYRMDAELPTTAPAVMPGCIFGCRWWLWDWRRGVRRCMQNGKVVKRIDKCKACQGDECKELTSYVWLEP